MWPKALRLSSRSWEKVRVRFDGLVQGLLHLPVPGVVHPAGNELPGHEKEEQGGQQGQTDEGEDQPGAQPGAEDLAASLQEELCQVAKDEEEEEQQQEGVEIEQSEGEEAAGDRLAAPVHQVHFQGGDGHHQGHGDGDEGPFRRRLRSAWSCSFVSGRLACIGHSTAA